MRGPVSLARHATLGRRRVSPLPDQCKRSPRARHARAVHRLRRRRPAEPVRTAAPREIAQRPSLQEDSGVRPSRAASRSGRRVWGAERVRACSGSSPKDAATLSRARGPDGEGRVFPERHLMAASRAGPLVVELVRRRSPQSNGPEVRKQWRIVGWLSVPFVPTKMICPVRPSEVCNR